MKNSLFLTILGGLFFQSAVFAESGHDLPFDSAKYKQSIYQRLDFISELTQELVDPSLIASSLPTLTPPTVQGRLSVLQKDVPLDYNDQVQSYIDRYRADRYQSHLSRMLGLGQYYFPVFEKNFKEVGIPEEIKYLSIIESALDPHAVSRAGATGPWQFMHATARVYGLEMDRHIDERKDPDIASHAAARYIKAAHERFGDWLLAIAAYNCGPGNVLKAINRSGKEHPDFWEIQPFLPKETRNYIPAFIAMLYVMESHEDFGIEAAETHLQIKTEVVNVQNRLSFSMIAAVIQEDESLLETLNPAYKGGTIHGSFDQPRKLILPEVSTESYPHLYAILHETHALPEDTQMLIAQAGAPAVKPSMDSSNNTRTTYTVRRGDTLSGIASKHKGTTVSRIKTANNLKNNRIHPGMKLIITF